MSTPRRRDGWAAIGDYAIVGDGRTVALIARDGEIDWWPVPTLDSPPVCGAILDPPAGGSCGLAPEGDFEAERRYLPGTNVLETTFTTAGGRAVVTETLNSGSAGRLPWTELARRVEGVEGEVEMGWHLSPGDRFGRARPWVSTRHTTPVVHLGDQSLAVVLDGAEPAEVHRHSVRGRLVTRAGRRQLVAVVATDDEPLFLPDPAVIQARIDRTVASWRRWSDLADCGTRWSEAVMRSALALKTLLYEPDGAIAAAATTSLPERLGGKKNWDYRYSWVRDSSFALDALIRLTLHEEVHASVSWLLDALRRTAPELHVFYTLSGEVADSITELDVPGYRGSRPVREGNSAAGQSQLGTYGDLFDTVHRYVSEGHVLDPATSGMLADLADRCCDTWMSPDSGIWELPDLQHYTISKIGCWVALDRAVSLADAGQVPDRHRGRWETEAADIKEWVVRNCWSAKKHAYSFYAGTDLLDAAVLLAGRTGFDRGERLGSTIDAVRSELGDGPCVYRYSGMRSEEGAFIACSFWVVDALTRVGRIEEACALMDEAVGLANDVGLMAEEIDPRTREQLGNVPQGLSHLALVNSAHTLEDALRAGGS